MFYYRVTKTTAAVPQVVQTSYLQFGGWRSAGQYMADLIGGGLYSSLTIDSIDQATFRRHRPLVKR